MSFVSNICAIRSINTSRKMSYSHTSVLIGFRTHQTLYSSHFDEKKMFQHLALAWDLLHPARENTSSFGTRPFWHPSWVPERINDEHEVPLYIHLCSQEPKVSLGSFSRSQTPGLRGYAWLSNNRPASGTCSVSPAEWAHSCVHLWGDCGQVFPCLPHIIPSL